MTEDSVSERHVARLAVRATNTLTGNHVVFILGAGCALPDTVLEDGHLARGDYSSPCSTASHGILSRRTVLPLSYIVEEGNGDPMNPLARGAESPTTLGVAAVAQALERADLSSDKIGLFIGDSSTPYQTTPSEAQRVAGKLGLKVNAYDLLASGVAMVLHLETIGSWREECIPDYVVSLSSNALTRATDMRSGTERFIFGDGAGALVMSTRHRGPLRCVTSEFFSDTREIGALTIPFAGHLAMSSHYHRGVTERVKSLFSRAVRGGAIDVTRCHLISSCATEESVAELSRELKLSREQIWTTFGTTGDMLGATPYAVLAEHWAEIRAGDQIVVALGGTGIDGGFAVFQGV